VRVITLNLLGKSMKIHDLMLLFLSQIIKKKKSMKNAFALSIAALTLLMITSCGGDELEYPSTFSLTEVSNYSDIETYEFQSGSFVEIEPSEFGNLDTVNQIALDEVSFQSFILETETACKLTFSGTEDQSLTSDGTFAKDGDELTFSFVQGLDLYTLAANLDEIKSL